MDLMPLPAEKGLKLMAKNTKGASNLRFNAPSSRKRIETFHSPI
jgi:hypothetical protein